MLLRLPDFHSALRELEDLERGRPFCRHDLEHFLSVARIGWILWHKSYGMPCPEEELYAAALLHDLGRIDEYLLGEDHAAASVRRANLLLPECGFRKEEVARICEAIALHREDQGARVSPLADVLHRADRESRLCFSCPAYQACKWTEEEKQRSFVY